MFNNLQGKSIVIERSYKCLHCGFIVKSKLSYDFCPKCGSGDMRYFDPDDAKIKELKNPFGDE